MTRKGAARMPWYKWSFKDWRADQAVKLCSRAARSFWVDLLALMYLSERCGYLQAAGKPFTVKQLAKELGDDPRSIQKWLVELESNKVFSRTVDGVIYSRRMVKQVDLDVMDAAKPEQTTGENPGNTQDISREFPGNYQTEVSDNSSLRPPKNKRKNKKEEEDKGSLRSPSAHTRAREKAPDEVESAFNLWWQSYPSKAGRKKALEVYRRVLSRGQVTSETLTIAVLDTAWSPDPSMIPHASTWLNGGRWSADDIAESHRRYGSARQQPSTRKSPPRNQWVLDAWTQTRATEQQAAFDLELTAEEVS